MTYQKTHVMFQNGRAGYFDHRFGTVVRKGTQPRTGAGCQEQRRAWRCNIVGAPHGATESGESLLMPGDIVETKTLTFTRRYLDESRSVIDQLDEAAIERVVALLVKIRSAGGRLFILGVGGSAANASHAVNDFRKIVGLEAYAPTDNVSELTARTNDEGWETVFESWLKTSRLQSKDGVLIFSVGGGNLQKNVSPNLVRALEFAYAQKATILGIVGRDGGFTAQVADACVIIPTVSVVNTTPHAEAFQAVVWHLLVSHPALKVSETKWESVK